MYNKTNKKPDYDEQLEQAKSTYHVLVDSGFDTNECLNQLLIYIRELTTFHLLTNAQCEILYKASHNHKYWEIYDHIPRDNFDILTEIGLLESIKNNGYEMQAILSERGKMFTMLFDLSNFIDLYN